MDVKKTTVDGWKLDCISYESGDEAVHISFTVCKEVYGSESSYIIAGLSLCRWTNG